MNWTYETGRSESEILGSGSQYFDVITTRNEEDAFKYFYDKGRTYLIRYKYDENKNKITEWYEWVSKQWMPD